MYGCADPSGQTGDVELGVIRYATWQELSEVCIRCEPRNSTYNRGLGGEFIGPFFVLASLSQQAGYAHLVVGSQDGFTLK